MLEWATGLDAPKGLALANNRLYVSDIDQLVAIDTATGAVAQRWPATGAKFLNDVVADMDGRVFVSDMVTNQIWLLDRSEEHTSELQSLMRISYAVFCLKKKTETS